MIASKDKWRLKSPLSAPEDQGEPDKVSVSRTRDPQSTLPVRRATWQPRFGLGTMMLVLLVCAMTAAGGRYLLLALSAGASSRAIFVIFVLVVPVVLLIVMNLVRLVAVWFETKQRQK